MGRYVILNYHIKEPAEKQAFLIYMFVILKVAQRIEGSLRNSNHVFKNRSFLRQDNKLVLQCHFEIRDKKIIQRRKLTCFLYKLMGC
ncbi:hypothetical protein JM83_2823 [Gillisia sp. Hel_I_86]|nr:hypothetical protein JM83_2823 [Gillisia sp. Hel_I_86]